MSSFHEPFQDLKRKLWKQLVLDSHLLLASGGAALAGYLELIVHRENGFQVVPGTFLFFMTTYALHALVGLKLKDVSLVEVQQFWGQRLSKSVLLCLVVAWLSYLLNQSWSALGYLVFACLTPIYSMPRKMETLPTSFKKPLVKLGVTLLAILGIYVYGVGVEIKSQQGSLFCLAVHLCINIVLGDLRDFEFDDLKKQSILGWSLDFRLVKRSLISLSLMMSLLSYMVDPVWVAIFLLNAGLVFRLTEKHDGDAYHVFDILHFLPWLISCIFLPMMSR